MRTIAMQSALLWAVALAAAGAAPHARQGAPPARQLLAVRGEIVKSKPRGPKALLITIKPAKEFAEVTVVAGENDLVGSAPGRAGGLDLFSMLAEDSRDEEAITAAELSEGDVVSIIYDPRLENRALEIYLH